MIDVDHFKEFNDTHGHLVGDQTLRLLAKVLQTTSAKVIWPRGMAARNWPLFCRGPSPRQQERTEARALPPLTRQPLFTSRIFPSRASGAAHRATAALVDGLDARLLKGASKNIQARAPRLASPGFCSFPRFSPDGFLKPHTGGPGRLGLLTMTFAQAHSGTAAILVDEFHTGSFQGAANCEVVRGSHRRLVVGQFGAADRGNTQRRLPRKIFSTPPNERTSGSDLCAGQ